MAEEDQLTEGGDEPVESQAQSPQVESRHYSVIGQTTADGRIMIGADIQIFPEQECKEFASPGTKAFDAKDRRLPGNQFAMLCGRSSIPRGTLIGSYKNMKSKSILNLIDAGIINWTPEGRQRLALIFDKPMGRRMMATPDSDPIMIPDERLLQTVIRPVVSALTDLKNIDFSHGSIHPGNMFLTGRDGLETVVLGECLSGAASSWQSPVYEAVSRAPAKPDAGRGPGTIKDDLYALGVSVVMISSGKSILRGRTPQQLLYDKIEHGSYSAVLGEERVPAGLAEFLRGVLNDDIEQRWDLDDVGRWLEGRRLGPKQGRIVLKGARPLIFQGQKLWDLRSVAEAFSSNINEAAAEIEKGQFVLWLKRNFDDKPLKLRCDKVWEKEKIWPRERLLAGVCMALDPFGPVRYKGLALFPNGIGTALAIAVSNNQDVQIYAEMILQQLFSTWISQIADDLNDASSMTILFEKCRTALTQKMPGYGIERVVYLLNPEVGCLSPLLKNYFVLVPGSLLLALESISRQAEKPPVILDRHMIAFISVREPKMIDTYLGHINSSSKASQIVGIVRTLAAIQRRFLIGPVPGVGNWIISMTAPLIETIHDRDLRQTMTRQINKLVDNGNLSALLDVIDDRTLIQNDAQRYTAAVQEYTRLGQEKAEVEDRLRQRRTFGRSLGRQVAMIFSSVVSIALITIYIIMRITRGF